MISKPYKSTITYVKKQITHVNKQMFNTRPVTLKRIGIKIEKMDQILSQKHCQDFDFDSVIITDINKLRAADRAGLKVGDIIKIVNNKTINTVSDFMNIINKMSSDDRFVLGYTRKKKGIYDVLIEC